MSYLTELVENNASPHVYMLGKIEQQLEAHPGWEFVKEFTPNATAGAVRVWKSLGTANDWGQDFFLLLWAKPSDTSKTMYMLPCEVFNPDTNQVFRPCPDNGTATPDATFFSRHGATAAAWTGALPVNSTSYAAWQVNTITSYRFWLTVTANQVILASDLTINGGGNGTMYAGLFEPFFVHSQEFPLCLGYVGVNGGINTFTRRPGESQSLGAAFVFGFTEAYSALLNGVGLNDSRMGTTAVGSRVKLVHNTAGTSEPDRGLFYDLLRFDQDASVMRGDTITINGATWLCIVDNGTYGIYLDTTAD